MAERKGARTTKGMARQQCYGRVREIHYSREQRVKAICIGERISFAFLEIETRAEELGVIAAGYDCAWRVGAEGALDVVVAGDELAAEGGGEAVFWGLLQGYDEDVSLSV